MSPRMSLEEEPFLPPDGKVKDPDNTYPQRPPPQSPWQYSRPALLLTHLGIIAIYTITAFLVIRSQRCYIIYPPAAVDNLDISYKTTLFHRLNATPYAGPPSEKIDAAWDALLAPMHITVSNAELKRDNQASVALPETGGYLGWMGVFHELHCIVSSITTYAPSLSQEVFQEMRRINPRLLFIEDASRVELSLLLPPERPIEGRARTSWPAYRSLLRDVAAISCLPRRCFTHDFRMASAEIEANV